MTDGLPYRDLRHVRPLTTLEMLDRIVRTCKSHPRVFIPLGLLVSLPSLMLTIFIAQRGANLSADDLAKQLVNIVPWLIVPWIVMFWAIVAMITAGFQAFLFPQRPLPLIPAMRVSLPRLPQFVLVQLFTVSAFLIFFTYLPPRLLATGEGFAGLIAGMAAIWLIFAGIYFLIGWSLASVVVVVERRNFVQALARSLQLMRMAAGLRDRTWRAAGTPSRRVIALVVFPAFVWVGGSLILEGVSLLPHDYFPIPNNWVEHLPSWLGIVINPALAFVVWTWTYIGLTLLYADCRIRLEALDLQVRLLSRGEFPQPMDVPEPGIPA